MSYPLVEGANSTGELLRTYWPMLLILGPALIGATYTFWKGMGEGLKTTKPMGIGITKASQSVDGAYDGMNPNVRKTRFLPR